jgi:DNA replication protein DnaC
MSLGQPKLLFIDDLGHLPFERRRVHLFFQLVGGGTTAAPC